MARPVADLCAIGVAELDAGEFLGVDLDDGDVRVLIGTDHCGWTAIVATVGVGRELDEYLVGFIDDVIVGDDVAAWVDDEAGAEGAALCTHDAVAIFVTLSALPPKKRLKKSCMSPGCWSSPPCGRLGRPRRRGFLILDCLGSDSVLMLTTAGPTCLTICEKPLESDVGEGMTSGLARMS